MITRKGRTMKRKRNPLLDLADSVEGGGGTSSPSDETEDSNNEGPSSRSGKASASNPSRGEVFPAHLALPALPASLETHSHEELVGFIRRYHSLLKHRTSRLSALDSHLHCAICTSYFVGPYNLECGHIFCYHCILAWFNNLEQNSRPKKCPTCRADTTCRPQYERTVSRLVEDYLTVVNDEESRTILQNINELRDSHAALTNHPFHEHFPNDFGDRILPDVDDGVVRCSRCNWEVLNGTCQGCGNVYRDARDSEESEEEVDYFDEPGWSDSESDLSFVVDDGDGPELGGGPYFSDDYEGYSGWYDESDFYDSDYGLDYDSNYGLSDLDDMLDGLSDTDMLGGDDGYPWHDEDSISPDDDDYMRRHPINNRHYDDSDCSGSSFDRMFGDSPDADSSGRDRKDANVGRIPPTRNSPPMSSSDSEYFTGCDDQSQDEGFEVNPIGRRRSGRPLPISDSESDDENQERELDHDHTDQSRDVRRHRKVSGGSSDDNDASPVIRNEEENEDSEENEKHCTVSGGLSDDDDPCPVIKKEEKSRSPVKDEKLRRSVRLDHTSNRKGKQVASTANKKVDTESQLDQRRRSVRLDRTSNRKGKQVASTANKKVDTESQFDQRRRSVRLDRAPDRKGEQVASNANKEIKTELQFDQRRPSVRLDRTPNRKGKQGASNANKKVETEPQFDCKEEVDVPGTSEAHRQRNGKKSQKTSDVNKKVETEPQFDCKEEVDIPGTSKAHRQRNDKKSQKKRKLHDISNAEVRLAEVGAKKGTESSRPAVDPERKKRKKRQKSKPNSN